MTSLLEYLTRPSRRSLVHFLGFPLPLRRRERSLDQVLLPVGAHAQSLSCWVSHTQAYLSWKMTGLGEDARLGETHPNVRRFFLVRCIST